MIEKKLEHNVEQLRAFELVAHHVCFGGPQLLMYIGGVGGTGKSYVVEAILSLFTLIGRRHEILVGAPTGAAAILIGGQTIHSLALLPNVRGRDIQQLSTIWKDVTYLIVDEVSMISALFLSQLSARLQQAKGDSELAEEAPFGGINVIFTGDFAQLRPVKGSPLYSHRLINHPRLQDAQNRSVISALKGVYLWRLVNTVVILRRNQRQQGDSAYAQLLSRVRVGKSEEAYYTGSAHDFATLQSRVLHNIHLSPGGKEALSVFSDAPIIVGRKRIRDLINARIILHHSRAIEGEVHLYHSLDRLSLQQPTETEQQILWALSPSITRDSPGKVLLFPGMKVMIQENLAFSRKVVNGARGTVRDIVYTEDNGIRYPTVVYVHIPGAGRICEDIEDDIVPIFPESSSFRWSRTHSEPRDVSISRLQLPLLPAYSYTDYKAQGQSLERAIVDISSALSLQGVYVMLSRVKTSTGLAILRPFAMNKIHDRLSQELRTELYRLETLDEHTRRSHNLRMYSGPT